MDVFAVGTDGLLYHFSSIDNQNWQGPAVRGGGDLKGFPSAIATGALDELDVLTIGTGGLYTTSAVKIVNQTIFLPTQFRAFGTFQYAPSLIRLTADGELYGVAVNTAGQLEVFGTPPFFPGFGLWSPLGVVEGEYVGSPVTFSYGVGQMGILAIREDGNLVFAVWDLLANFGQVVGIVPANLGGDGNRTAAPGVSATTLFDASVAAVGAGGHWFFTALQNASWTAMKDLGNGNMVPFLTRTTTAFVQSQQLALAMLAGSTSIMLDVLVLGLTAGQHVSLTGSRTDSTAVQQTELLELEDVSHDGGFTTLHLKHGLQHSYRRDSVSINANVTDATHGATVQEILGSADGSKSRQTFELKRPPLTFVPAATPSGVETTLSVRVNDVEWKEADTLAILSPQDRAYTVRHSDDGATTIAFGDPAARPRSGQQNVRALYRTGIGRAGNVKANSLSMLLTRPPGLRGVVNPLPAEGGADPQPASKARQNAPLTVLTLGRIVSLKDYENYARAFAGVGKAQAVEIWSGESRIVCLTVATSTCGTLASVSTLYKTLVASINDFHDPVQICHINGFQKITFNITAVLRVDESTHCRAAVDDAVRAAIVRAFSFDNREFGQAVTAAEIVALIQGVPGVLGCALTQLYISGDPSGPAQKEAPPYLPALPARFEKGGIKPAQLLLLNAKGLSLGEMKA